MPSSLTISGSRRATGLPEANRPEIERAILLLFEPQKGVEVRIPETRIGVVTGYFDTFSPMAHAIAEAGRKYRAGGIYYVLNRLDRALLGRAYNLSGDFETSPTLPPTTRIFENRIERAVSAPCPSALIESAEHGPGTR